MTAKVVRVEEEAYVTLKKEVLERHGALYGHLKQAVTEAMLNQAEKMRRERSRGP